MSESKPLSETAILSHQQSFKDGNTFNKILLKWKCLLISFKKRLTTMSIEGTEI